MRTLQLRQIFALAMLLALAAAPCIKARTLSASDTVQVTNGAVSEKGIAAGIPAGRQCIATGMHCSSSSQCCSKGCNTVYFRCGSTMDEVIKALCQYSSLGLNAMVVKAHSSQLCSQSCNTVYFCCG